MSAALRHQRVEFATAAEFVSLHHRHHTPPAGHIFSIGAFRDSTMVGVAIVGRPVSRRRDDGLTAEITRLCVHGDEPLQIDRNGKEHAPAACSFLYGRCARAAFALGFRRIGTYTLKRESGVSPAAAGYVLIGETPGRSWDVPSRPRSDKHPLEPRFIWERAA